MNGCARYLGGLGLTYIATLIFIGLGWADVGPWGTQRFIVPLIMAVVIWTIIFISHEVVWQIMQVFGGGLLVLFVIGAIMATAYSAFLVCEILLPPEWLTIKRELGHPYVISGVYATIDLALHPRRFSLVTKTKSLMTNATDKEIVEPPCTGSAGNEVTA
ncbi:MAG: hypothetical protein AAB972_05375 [Patescibacteria group bacterium]